MRTKRNITEQAELSAEDTNPSDNLAKNSPGNAGGIGKRVSEKALKKHAERD